MAKKLIIAEKPSVAADIARALGGFTRKGDYYESEEYVLSSAVGHLLELALPEKHDVKKGKWSFAKLPVIPPHFELAPIEKEIEGRNLLFIPHGILHYVPMHALRAPDGTYLIARGEIAYAPSATVHRLCARKQTRNGAAGLLAARARARARARAGSRLRPAAARGQHLGPALAGREARHALARLAPGRSAARSLRRARRRAVSSAAQGLVRLPVWRARVVLIALVAGFAVLAARAVYLQAVKTDFLQEKGVARFERVIEIPATRGRILLAKLTYKFRF